MRRRAETRRAGSSFYWPPWRAEWASSFSTAKEWSNLIAEGLRLPIFPAVPDQEVASEFANVSKTVPQFAATFFGLTGMHMLHVTLGVVYLGVIALRRKFIPILLALLAGGVAGHARLTVRSTTALTCC